MDSDVALVSNASFWCVLLHCNITVAHSTCCMPVHMLERCHVLIAMAGKYVNKRVSHSCVYEAHCVHMLQITPKTTFTHPISVQSKNICQPQSARYSGSVFSSQQLYLPSSTPILKPAAPATAWCQNSSALSPQASHTSTVFAQQDSALFSESGISSSELHCQHTSALLSEPGPSNEMSHQHCSALDEGPAQPTATQCQNNFVSHWELQHCAAPFCQHCPTPLEPLQDCSVLSDALVEDLSMVDLPAIEDLTAGSALSFSGGGW